MAAKKASKSASRAIDLRRVVVYDLTGDEKERATAIAAGSGRSLSRWVARLIRAEMDRQRE